IPARRCRRPLSGSAFGARQRRALRSPSFDGPGTLERGAPTRLPVGGIGTGAHAPGGHYYCSRLRQRGSTGVSRLRAARAHRRVDIGDLARGPTTAHRHRTYDPPNRWHRTRAICFSLTTPASVGESRRLSAFGFPLTTQFANL